MKAIARLIFFTFVLSFLLATPSSAYKREDAVKAWLKHHSFLGKSVGQQAQIGLRSYEALRYRMDSMIIQSPDTATLLTTTPQKLVFLYDASGKHQAILKYERDKSSLPWSMVSRDFFTYDAQGRILNDTLFAKSSNSGLWFQSEIRENLFDAQGRLFMESSKYRYNEDDIWEGEFKKEYQFNTSGKLVGQLSYTLSKEDVWIQSGKRVSLSDGTRDTAWYVYRYNLPQDAWTLTIKELCQYDLSGQNNLTMIKQWNADSSCWSIRRKIDYAYDAWGNKVREFSYDLDSVTNEWVEDGGEEWSYDIRGNLLSNTSVLGKDAWIFWGLTMKTEFDYDYSIASTDVYPPLNPIDSPTFNMVTGGALSMYMPTLDSWYESAKINCYYTDLSVAIAPVSRSKTMSWFYDPSTNCVLFERPVELATVKLFDLQGRLVLQNWTSDPARLSLNGLAKGLYLIRMVSGGRVMQGKVQIK